MDAGTAAIDGDRAVVDVHVRPRARLPEARDWRVVVALTQASSRTRVLRGENGGEELHEAAIVRALSERLPLPPTARDAVRITLSKPRDLAWQAVELAAFVQSETSRDIAGAVAFQAAPRNQKTIRTPDQGKTMKLVRVLLVMLAVAVPSSWTLAHAGDDIRRTRWATRVAR